MSQHRSLLERYVERYNAGDLDTIMDLYAEDAVQLMPDGYFEGRSAIRERWRGSWPRSRICRGALYYDTLAVVAQLGLLPQGAPSAV